MYYVKILYDWEDVILVAASNAARVSLYPLPFSRLIVFLEKSAALPNIMSLSSFLSMYVTLVTSNLPFIRS